MPIAVGPQLFRALRHRIASNDDAPGMRLSEAEVAASQGVSRRPVRLAFLKLADPALVAELTNLIAGQRQAVAADPDAVVPLDDMFHRTRSADTRRRGRLSKGSGRMRFRRRV